MYKDYRIVTITNKMDYIFIILIICKINKLDDNSIKKNAMMVLKMDKF